MHYLLILLLSGFSFAQVPDFQADPLSMAGQASLITFRYEPGAPSAKLYVVGHEAARINFEEDVQLIEITAFDGENREELRFQPDRGYYLVKNPPTWGQPYQIRVRARVNDQERVINLQIKP